ncbi:MAG: hypothetical protein GC136_05825 [Alphaproteobacteria bacterium]|nr:hypothetical protein [Alphaproteobacteria bacterium]
MVRLFLLLLYFSAPAFAQEQITELCQTLQAHKPADDINYKAGVDVNGNAVVSADINGANNFFAGQPFSFPLTVDAAAYLGVPPPAGVEMKGNIGDIKVYPDGRVSFNGQDISQQVMQKCDTVEPASGNTAATIAAPDAPVVAAPLPADDPNAIMRETLAPPVPAIQAPVTASPNLPDSEEFFGGDGQERLND